MKLGIVGLPNVGKSTLFNAITNAGAESANYPFCTIDPNVGMVAVPDYRLDKLSEMYHPKKTTPAVIEFVDIAGLVKGASRGEGLGNKFLANIRQTDAIVHVVRCFDDENVIHVEGSTDPIRDMDTIDLELILADAEMVDRRIDKAQKAAKGDKKFLREVEVFSGLERLLSLEFASSLSDALYHLRHNSLDAGRIGILVQRMGDVDLLPPCRSLEDLLEGTGAGCGELLEMILRETEYDHVILDLGSFSGASAELMELCDIIYMPILKDRVSQGKEESFTAYLEGEGRTRILEGLRKVELSEPCRPRPGENYLEGLLLSPLGDQVRGLSL